MAVLSAAACCLYTYASTGSPRASAKDAALVSVW